MFGSGRLPAPDTRRLNTADLLLAAVNQSGGQLKFEDFTPPALRGSQLRHSRVSARLDGRIHSVSEFLDFGHLQGISQDKVHYTLEDLARCGCETEPLGALLKTLELRSSIAFRIMVKPFMDAWTWDQDRIDRCCTHVIRSDGSIDSLLPPLFGIPGYHRRFKSAMTGLF